MLSEEVKCKVLCVVYEILMNEGFGWLIIEVVLLCFGVGKLIIYCYWVNVSELVMVVLIVDIGDEVLVVGLCLELVLWVYLCGFVKVFVMMCGC